MDIWVVCAFWLLLIMVLWKFMYKLFKWIFSVLLSVYLGVELLGHIYCMFNFWKNCQIVFHRWCTILHSYLQFMRAEFHTFSPICFFPSYTTTLMMSVGIPGGSVVKNLPAVQEMWVWSLGWEDPLEEGMATHSSILVQEVAWAEEPGGLQSYSPWGHKRVGRDLATNNSVKWYLVVLICSHLMTNNVEQPHMYLLTIIFFVEISIQFFFFFTI